MSLGPSSFKNIMSTYTTSVSACLTKKKGLHFLMDIAQKILNLELYDVGRLSHCRWIVAPPHNVG